MQWLEKQRLDDERYLDIYFYSSNISMNINEFILMSSIFIWFYPVGKDAGFHSFPVVDWFCLFIYLRVLTFPL
jgi:hypothetical protein